MIQHDIIHGKLTNSGC